MTYQASSNKLLKNEIKQRLWAVIIMFVAFFILEPMALLMTIDNFELYNDVSNIPGCISDYLSYGFALDGRYAMIAGGIFAFLCFGYLYSKSAVDLYHSLPVRREKIFLYKIIIGAGFGSLVLIICSAISFVIIGAKGYLTAQVLKCLMLTSLKGLLGFLLCYTTFTLAIMLTGTVVVGILGGAVLTLLPALADWIMDGYMSLCFRTYNPIRDKITVIGVLLNPIKLFDLSIRNRNFYRLFLAVFIEVLVLLLLSLLLYVKRPSESMSKAISFSLAKPIIRIPLVIFAALSSGLYVAYIASSLTEYWYWAAFISIGIIAHCVLELIFEQEFKAIFRHPVQFIACMAVATIISFSMQYDWFGYDTYIPGDDMLESATVRLENIEHDTNMYELNEFGRWDYSSRNDFFDKVSCDKDLAIKLARTSISHFDKTSAIKRHMEDMKSTAPDFFRQDCSYLVCYHLNSGRDVYRLYQADIDEVYNDIAKVYEGELYKNIIYEISPSAKSAICSSIQCMDALSNEVFTAREIDPDKFLDAYSKDLHDRKLDDVKNFPIFTLNSYDMESGMDFLSMYAIYETDTNTLEYMKSVGINIDDYRFAIDADSIKSIKAMDYNVASEYGEPYSQEYTAENDFDKIKYLADKLIPSNMAYINGILHPVMNNELYVEYFDKGGMLRETYCQVPLGTEVF